MEIVFAFQGEEVYRIDLPANIKKVTFEMGPEVEVYAGCILHFPTIKEIEFFEERGVAQLG